MSDLKIGADTPSAIKIGSTDVLKVMQGTVLVWPIAGGNEYTTVWDTEATNGGNASITLPVDNAYTYNFVVEWGDGSSDSINSTGDPANTHVYASPGIYTVSITGLWQGQLSNTSLKECLIGIESMGDVGWIFLDQAFFNCVNLATMNVAMNPDHLSTVTSFVNAWKACGILAEFPPLNLSGATNIDAAWANCFALTSFPLVDISSAQTANASWSNCSGLTSFPLLAMGTVQDISNAWSACSSLVAFPLIDTSSAISANNAWLACGSLTSFPILDLANVAVFSNAWQNCSSIVNFPALNLASATTLNSAWYNCDSLVNFPAVLLPSATNLDLAWRDCGALETIAIGLSESIISDGVNLANPFLSSNLYTDASYSNFLIGLDTGAAINGNLSGGKKYTVAGSAARANLIAKGWTIADQGPV